MTFVKGRMPEMLRTNISSTKPFCDKVRLGLLSYYYFVAGNQLCVLLAILTNRQFKEITCPNHSGRCGNIMG